NGVAVDAAGRPWVVGTTSSSNFPTAAGAFQPTFNFFHDAFVSRFKADGSGLEFSSYLGGNSDDYGNAVALDSAGNAYVAGSTTQGAFQTALGGSGGSSGMGGSTDAFVSQLNPAGSALSFSSYLGGSSNDSANGVALDQSGNIYLTGQTSSTDFPTRGAAQGS